MAQDLRKMDFSSEEELPKLSEGHEAKFEALLAKEFGEKKKNKNAFFFLKIAAAVIIFFGIGYAGYNQFYNQENTIEETLAETENKNETKDQITIGDISPDLKKIEEFYTAGINVQLASLPLNPENKDLIDGYMRQLEELNKEYKILNEELNTVGPTEATVTALIDNLKLRLELLFKLKNKLKELKTLENEQVNSI